MSLNIVLYKPEIPYNTGNIGRTCVLTDTNLHLIKPYGFEINDKNVKRAGLDYWKEVKLFEYDSFEEFLLKNDSPRIFLSTTKTEKFHTDFEYKDNDYFMFGQESCGVPLEIHEMLKERAIRVPMVKTTTRSLNLCNSVSIVLYEALRQTRFINMK